MDDLDADRRVEEMIAEGRRICAEAVERHRPAAIVAAFSGGDDSIVSTHFAMGNLPGCEVVHADTLVALGPARRHVRAVCDRFGWPARVVAAVAKGPPARRRDGTPYPAKDWIEGATAYEEAVLNYGFAGPPSHPFMFLRLKGSPIAELRREIVGRGRRLMLVSGVRADESAIRAGYRGAITDQPKLGQVWVNPFYSRSAADFAAYRDEFGLPRNPVKARCGISGECCCGAFGRPRDERPAYRAIDPDFADYLDALEARVRERFPWGWGQSPPSWWLDARRGQGFLFDAFDGPPAFQPMCVGCARGRR